jgi:iron(III) transport system substrate-binding protein
MRPLSRCLALVVATAAAAALLPGRPDPSDAQSRELVVYTARHYGEEPALAAFTKKTGIHVKTLAGNATEMFERLKAEGARSPADILMTVDAGNLWKAADAGLLARVDSPDLLASIPAHLRDPQGRWFGLTLRARTIMYGTRKVKAEELSTYEALGDPKWKDRLCLRTSTYIYNQSLLGTMIARFGEPKTEAIARGWVSNNPTLINGDTKILEAIAAGQCDVGITNHYYLARILSKDPSFPVALFWANQQSTGTHVNISGAGVTASAKNRANAIAFIEFMASPEAQQMFADMNFEYPVNPQVSPSRLIAKWGTFKQDDTNIAAAGQYQAAATKLADRAGYR